MHNISHPLSLIYFSETYRRKVLISENTFITGKMYAFVATVENICILLGSLVFNSLYPVMREYQRGFIFHFAAMLHIIPFIIMW